jgi:hypothetical protein
VSHQAGAASRSDLAHGESFQYVKNNYRIEGLKSGVTYAAVSGATTTALTMPPVAKLPPGFWFIIDNSNGSDTLTITPDSGSTITAATTVVKKVVVTAAGTTLAVTYS